MVGPRRSCDCGFSRWGSSTFASYKMRAHGLDPAEFVILRSVRRTMTNLPHFVTVRDAATSIMIHSRLPLRLLSPSARSLRFPPAASFSSSTNITMSKAAPGHKDATYHTECTGQALETVKAHSSPSDLTLFGACFCPFVHRAWIALEHLDGKRDFGAPL